MTSLQQKDTTFTKIFVGGLPYHTTDDTLQRFFEPYGEIDEAVVITDRQTGKSRGYGFMIPHSDFDQTMVSQVTMSDRAAAERACKDPNPIIDGRKANVNLAYLGAKPRIPVGELIAAFPYGLKTGLPSYFGGTELLGLPQIVYQSGTAAAYLPTTPTSFTIATAAQAPAPHLLPAALLPANGGAGHFLDYAALAAAYSAATAPLTSTLSLGSDSMPTMAAAFPYNVPTAGGGGGGGGGYFGGTPTAPTAYATLPYATGAIPTQTVLGQFTAQQFHTQHVHTTKLQ